MTSLSLILDGQIGKSIGFASWDGLMIRVPLDREPLARVSGKQGGKGFWEAVPSRATLIN